MKWRTHLFMAATLPGLSVLAGASRAQETITIGVRIPTELGMDLACAGDMAPRGRALLRFLAERGFTAADFASRGGAGQQSRSNTLVMGVDEQKYVVGLWSDRNARTPQSYRVNLSAPPPLQAAQTQKLRDALERLVRESFDCEVVAVHHDGTEPMADQYDKWVRAALEDIHEAAATGPSTIR